MAPDLSDGLSQFLAEEKEGLLSCMSHCLHTAMIIQSLVDTIKITIILFISHLLWISIQG